jgi:hypothetical protein
VEGAEKHGEESATEEFLIDFVKEAEAGTQKRFGNPP